VSLSVVMSFVTKLSFFLDLDGYNLLYFVIMCSYNKNHNKMQLVVSSLVDCCQLTASRTSTRYTIETVSFDSLAQHWLQGKQWNVDFR
jgi:hypothetical protein